MAILKKSVEKLKSEGSALRQEAGQRTLGYIVAAFGLVAGLAWNDAIKSLIEHFFPSGGSTLFAKFFYAIIITLIVVVVTAYLVRWVGKRETKDTT